MSESLTLSPIDQQASWLGTELPQRDDWEHRLTETEVDELLRFAENPPADEDAEGNLAQQLGERMPQIAARLDRVRENLESGSGAALIRGFPIDRLPQPTIESMFIAMMSRVGTPVSQTSDGHRLFHVRDEGYAKSDPRARGPSSRNRLTFHSDRCDVIAFLCIKDARQGGESDIVSSVKIFELMKQRRPDLVDVLMQPFYYKRHNVDSGNEHAFYRQPVFSMFQDRFASSLLRVLIERAYADEQTPEMSDQQREALDMIEEIANEPDVHFSFRQTPGDIMLLNNFVTLHRRTEFEDHEDPSERRHLLRLWLAVPNSRPLDPMFEASYGATKPGVVRGGFRHS